MIMVKIRTYDKKIVGDDDYINSMIMIVGVDDDDDNDDSLTYVVHDTH